MKIIMIPSKARPNSKLIGEITERRLPHLIFVEPQDKKDYLEAHPQIALHILPKSEQGITYVRNYIKEYAEKNAIKAYWQLDDDITGFYKRNEGKMLKTDMVVALEGAEKICKENGIALGALEYQQFAWSATNEITINSFCDSCVLVDNEKTYRMRYNPYLEGKEDRDFAMQVIREGMKTGRVTLYGFGAPANGSNAGGLKESFYDVDGKEEALCHKMVEVWGEYICRPIVKKNGRRDVKIYWKNIQKNQTSLF